MKIRPVHGVLFTFFIVFFTLAYLKYRSFNTIFDLPIYYQSMWNTLEGRPMYTTMYLPQGYNQLGDHWSPILYLFLPVLYLFKSPETLLFIQSLFLVLGALPIYWLAREKFGSPGLIFPVAYLLHPTIWYSNLNDFHPTSIAAGIVSFCFYYCYKKEYKKFLILLFLLLNTKEDLALVGMGFSAYIFFVNRDRRAGVALFTASAVWLVFVTNVVMPYFSAGLFDAEGYYMKSRYGYLGGSITEALSTIVFHPLIVLKNVVTLPKIAYLISIFLPSAFLSLLSPGVLLIAAPILAENLLSTYLLQYLPTTQYSTVLIPLLYIAGIFSIDSVKKVKKKKLITVLLLFSFISNIGYGPPPQGIIWQLDTPFDSSYKHISFKISERDRLAEEMIKDIPENAPVAATTNLIPHMPMRPDIYMISQVNISFLESRVDYVFFDTENYLFRKYDIEPKLLEEVSASSRFKVMRNESGLTLFERPR